MSYKKEEDLFDEIYQVYRQYSAIGLMNLTHGEKSWKSSTSIGSGSVNDLILYDAIPNLSIIQMVPLCLLFYTFDQSLLSLV